MTQEEKIEPQQDQPIQADTEQNIQELPQESPQTDVPAQNPEETDSSSKIQENLVPFEEHDVTIESVIEAILFATDEPLSETRIITILEAGSPARVREAIDVLNEKYENTGLAFRIEKIAGGYQMMTQPQFNYWLKKLVRERTDNKLTPAALETLAIIAYKQTVIRADVEAIRGVASGEMIRSLMFKGLVKIAGRAEVLGRPILYGTTKKFLEVFGLASLKDLPKVEELKQPQQ
ncbi:MAG: SMC-Scp complex subunit ScpB [Victivallales bacterium]|nr:SMC-Scp complex subunit ScpB [Victivallales bacterium]